MSTTKTFVSPNISCGHCTNTIEMEVGEMTGVTSVNAEIESKEVTVVFDPPATWEGIKETLVEINFPAAE